MEEVQDKPEWLKALTDHSSPSAKQGSLSPPVHDLNHVSANYYPGDEYVRQESLDNPKSAVWNYQAQWTVKPPRVQEVKGTVEGILCFRCTINVHPNITGVGDGINKNEAVQLAAISVYFQLLQRDKKTKEEGASGFAPPSVYGSKVGYERARTFMDYYCHRFGFPKPEVELQPKASKGRSYWQGVLIVGGRRVGIGSAMSKKVAGTAAYMDAVKYLIACDGELWSAFLAAEKTGEDLGFAPRLRFDMSPTVDRNIRELCRDIQSSNLYRNAPDGDSTPKVLSARPLSISVRSSFVQQSPMFHKTKSAQLLMRRNRYLDNPALAAMRAQRGSLPVMTQAESVLYRISQQEVTICMAATGSGKTTQIPQLILDSAIEAGEGSKCNIVCTQPRRIAAISVAQRVAQERGESVGLHGSVGYQVRFETKLPEDHGSITFCTTGIFLKRLQSYFMGAGNEIRDSRHLDSVSHIVVDEVHERDIDTDLLLVVLKRLLADRRARNVPIKIILMSATIDPTLFQEYFVSDGETPLPVIDVPGRSFPVEKHFLDDTLPTLADPALGNRWVFSDPSVAKFLAREFKPPSQDSQDQDNNDAIDELEIPFPLVGLTIAHVLSISQSGHVLVFLPGWEEIMAVQRILLDSTRPLLGVNFRDTETYSIHLLHSSIPVQEQQVIFKPPAPGVRRIILATNIAETSITIPDVVYVVDTAKIKETRYDPNRHMTALVSAWVGSSNLNQRAGRAGRHRPGEYFGILSRRRAASLNPYQTVEMKRSDLSNVVMHVKALNFPNMAVEEVLAATIEPPESSRVEAAISDLIYIGALDKDQHLTPLGKVLLLLPIDVHLGRMCLDKALTLAAILQNREPFLSPPLLKREAAAVKGSWSPPEFKSDVLAVLSAYEGWYNFFGKGDFSGANRFCMNNFLSRPTLLLIEKTKGQLLRSLYTSGVIDVSSGGTVQHIASNAEHVPVQLNVNANSDSLQSALIALASHRNFAVKISNKLFRTIRDKNCLIHPSSVNSFRWDRIPEEDSSPERQLFAFTEKRQNITVGSTSVQTFMLGTTRLDILTYLLFGANQLTLTNTALECDGWIPVIGYPSSLENMHRLRQALDACMLRVFEGISKVRREERALSPIEMQELDLLTRDLVTILDKQGRRSGYIKTTSGNLYPKFCWCHHINLIIRSPTPHFH
ncbi:P-loop containing nucleoside triphosphate hydrolase protein [Hysterangium stoloniferum]|nr:P-loop containing nucleoside triphosphate hydrolase protein [Hysterangium stoloniferum]